MNVIGQESYISINLYDEGIRATAEASRIPGQENLWFFNRLVVDPPSKRGEGHGARLLNQLLKIMQKRKASLINEVSDYGSGDPSRLIEWYKTFGFYENENEPGVLRWDSAEKNPLITRSSKAAHEILVDLDDLFEIYHVHFKAQKQKLGINIYNLHEQLIQFSRSNITIDRDLLYRVLVELEALYRKAPAKCPECGSKKHLEYIVETAKSITKFIHLSVSHYWAFP